MAGESVTEFTAIKYHTVTKSEVVTSATDLLLSVAKQSEKLRNCRQNEFFGFVMRGKKMNCDKCVWYVVRMLTDEEAKYLRQNYPNIAVDTRFCVRGGCDGMRLFKERKEE